MPDIFLRIGDAVAQNVILRDPTQPDAGGGTSYVLTAQYGAFAFSAQTAGLVVARLLTASQGSFTLTPENVTLAVSRIVTATYGAFVLTSEIRIPRSRPHAFRVLRRFHADPESASLAAARTLTATYGAFILTSESATLLWSVASHSYTLAALYGAFALTAETAELSVGHYLSAAYGAFTLTAETAEIAAARVLTADYGAFTLSGQDADLTYHSASQIDYALDAETGYFTLSGSDAGLMYGALPAAVKPPREEGIPDSFSRGLPSLPFRPRPREAVLYALKAKTGRLHLTGRPATLGLGRMLWTTGARYTLKGNDADLSITRKAPQRARQLAALLGLWRQHDVMGIDHCNRNPCPHHRRVDRILHAAGEPYGNSAIRSHRTGKTDQ